MAGKMVQHRRTSSLPSGKLLPTIADLQVLLGTPTWRQLLSYTASDLSNFSHVFHCISPLDTHLSPLPHPLPLDHWCSTSPNKSQACLPSQHHTLFRPYRFS